MFRVITIIFLFFLLTPRGFSDPSISVSLSNDKIRIEEITTLNIQIEWPKSEGSYSFAIPDLPLNNLSLINRAESQESFPRNDQEWTQKVFRFDLSPQQAGEGIVEGFVIGYVNSTQGTQGQFEVSPLKITLIKPPFWNNFPLPLVLAAGGGVLLAGFLAALVLKRSQKKNTLEALPSAQEITLAEIKKRIQATQAFSESALFQMNQEFKQFLKEIYGIETSRNSEQEILDCLKQKNLLPEEFKTIEKILNQIREAKFTGQKLTEIDFQILKKEITTLIEGKQIQTFSSVN